MLKNYFKIALRNILRCKLYSFINIVGLTVGMSACILISFYVHDELSYDAGYSDAGRIYRVVMNIKAPNIDIETARASNPLAPVLKKDFPEVENSVRLRFGGEELVQSDYNRKFYERRVCYAGPEIFDVFSVPFIEGNPRTALDRPSRIVITQAMARKYFPGVDPLGKTLKVKNEDMEVAGVIRNVPDNTHLKYDFIASFNIRDIPDYDDWAHTWFYTYVKLRKNADAGQFAVQVKHVANKYYAQMLRTYGAQFTYTVQPVGNIHLDSRLSQEIEEPGSRSDILVFSIIAALLLLIACLNFINLTTARYSNRIREIGVRKVIGASRSQLIRQFMGETLIYSFCALIVTSAVVEAGLPWFNEISGKQLTAAGIAGPDTIVIVLGVILFIAVVAGSVPAFVLSSFPPTAILRSKQTISAGRSWLRKGLVITQFAISIVLIAGSLLLYQQLRFMKNQKLGFEKNQLVVLPLRSAVPAGRYESFKNEFLKNPSVISASVSWGVPGRANIGNGDFMPPDNPEFKDKFMRYMFADFDFQKTYGVRLAGGRSFQRQYRSDESSYMINEAAVKAFGWKTPAEAIGKRIFGRFHGGGAGPVIGVFKDFHFESLRNPIEPLVIKPIPEKESFYETPAFLNLKVSPKNVQGTMRFIRDKWRELMPDKPYNYSFLDDDFNMQYHSDERVSRIVLSFSILAILIACLGLLGLASYTAERRTKEIGVRKVMGASVPSLLLMLVKEFARSIVVANIFAWPVAYYFMSNWLKGFAYRTEISIWIFVASGILALLVALATVSSHAIKAATANPVKCLRYE